MNKSFQSILFLSTGRTGTKFLASILRDTVPDADVFHEAGERSRLINILSHANLSGVTPAALTIKTWQRSISDQLKQSRESSNYYIDANNHIYILAVNHPDLYSGLKVIHIVRDPRTYIRSHLNWSHSRIKSFLANYLTPFWQPSGFLEGDMGLGEWLRLSKLERFAWVWNFKNKYINQLEGTPTPYLWVRFEDLFSVSDPGSTYQEILDFIGLKDNKPAEGYFQKSINASKNVRVPEWTQWPAPLCSKIDQLCREGMEKFGYGKEPAWLDLISQDGANS